MLTDNRWIAAVALLLSAAVLAAVLIAIARRLMRWFRGPKPPSFTSKKRMSSRQIRQLMFKDVLTGSDGKLFDQAFMDAIDKKRDDYDKLFWKIALTQITITALLGLSLLAIDVNFSLFGLSSTAIFQMREFILVCHAIIIAYSIVIQQYIHQLEDVEYVYGMSQAKDDSTQPFYILKYLSPFEIYNMRYFPYRQNLYLSTGGRLLTQVQNVFKAVTFLGFAVVMMAIPLITAIDVLYRPNYGWISYHYFGRFIHAAVRCKSICGSSGIAGAVAER